MEPDLFPTTLFIVMMESDYYNQEVSFIFLFNMLIKMN